MVMCILCGACVAYNALYLSHCMKQGRYKSAFGTAAVIGLVAFGVMLLGFRTAW